MISSSISGISNAIYNVEKSAEKIANEKGDLVKNIEDMNINEKAVEANVKSIQTENDMMGSLLNIKV